MKLAPRCLLILQFSTVERGVTSEEYPGECVWTEATLIYSFSDSYAFAILL